MCCIYDVEPSAADVFLSFYGHVPIALRTMWAMYSYHIELIHAIEMVLHIQYRYSIQYANWKVFGYLWLPEPCGSPA